MELFKLLGTIAITNGEANNAIDETTGKGEQAQSKISKAFEKVGGAAVKAGKVIATGLAAGATAMGALTAKTMNAAGELEQNMGGSEAVFKESAERMQETAKEAFANMGLSASDFLGTANKMGALFQGAGFDIEESADMSAEAMQRAADVASIMGIDVNAAMEAVAGMAKGNFTMMDNLGVAINDTTLQIYAQEKGLGKLETTQQKVNAAYQLFMEKSEYAAGNYKKENETFAGAMTTAKAALDNFLSGAGTAEQLADAFVGAADVIIVKLNELFPKLVDGITGLIEKLTPEIPRLLQSLLPGLIQGAVALVNGLVQAMPAIIDVIMSLLPDLLNGILQITDAIISALPQIVEMICVALPGLIPQLASGIVSLALSLASMIPQLMQPIIDNAPEILISVVETMVANLPILIEGATQLILGLVEALPQVMAALLEAIPSIVSNLASAIVTCAPMLLNSVNKISNSMKDSVSNIWSQIVNFVKSGIEKIKSFMNFKWSLPKIKLPHFKIKGSFSLNPPSVPSFGIDWYAKAMDEGMILNQPTAFGINSKGQIMAGGEAGSETVVGTESLMNMIQNASKVDSAEMATAVREAIMEAFNNLDITANIQIVPDDRGIFKIVEKQATIKRKSTGRTVFA